MSAPRVSTLETDALVRADAASLLHWLEAREGSPFFDLVWALATNVSDGDDWVGIIGQ